MVNGMLSSCLRRTPPALLLLMLLFLHGCAVQSPFRYPIKTPAPPVQTPPSEQREPSRLPETLQPEPEAEPEPELMQRPEPVRPGPAHRLYTQAESARKAGQPGQAEMLIERALRIEPRNALYWHALAQVKYDQGQFAQTVQLCLKAESLARGNPELRHYNRILMELADRNLK